MSDPFADLLNFTEEKSGKGSRNHSQTTVSELKSNVFKTKFTEEQEKIIEAKENVIKVTAYAGTGKTFTLKNFAERNIKKRGLYIAFNRDLKLEAEKKFPSSVKCMTVHGLAYSRFGLPLQNKLKPFYSQHVYEVIKKPHSLVEEVYAKAVYDSVINFTYSSDKEIKKDHLALNEFNMLIKSLSETSGVVGLDEIKNIKVSTILNDVNTVWENMIDPNSNLGTTHDSYLKLMQLASPQLPYETILLDEAQDVNPAMLNLFEKQKCRKVLTGDPYQSIYQFRKAIDAMTYSYCDKNYFLSKSFRFGQSIADMANTLISLRGETKPVKGLESVKSRVELYSNHGLIKKLQSFSTKAVITRTNAKIFEEAVKYSSLGFNVYFEGGENIARFDLLEDLFNLLNNREQKDGFLKTFYESCNKNGKLAFETIKEFSEENGISDWLFRCKIVEKYKDNLNSTLNGLKKFIVQEKDDNSIIITNVHKSKGLEYDLVIISDDFNVEFLAKRDNKGLVDLVTSSVYEDVNLLYVALTRAKELLLVGEELLYHANAVSKELNNHFITIPDSKIVLNGSKEYQETLLKMRNNLRR